MNNLNSLRRGSALLIVLGMMAFIVVSAVAFAAYMRYSRLPSSYLRRTSASRLLAKAALAEAIDSIDRAIGNNPYPGVGNTSHRQNGSLSQKRDTETSRLCNHWEDRVFIGTTATVSPEDTISTLTLEGLAYIPAPFINEARYWSRRSPAAEWHTMGFDAGRYAFSAIDVSDCFDVNRLVADAPRDSSDENRITLSHCFEKHTSDTSSGDEYVLNPDKWDDFMSNYVDENHSKVPLVSVADLNLALADRLGGDIAKKLSPFYNYITTPNNARFVKNSGNEDAAVMRNLCFVTDSYFPVTNRVNGINLANAAHQPFDKFPQDKENSNDAVFQDIYDRDNKFGNQYKDKEILYPELACLYDYLDRDNIPMSLCLPTWERAPMITGVGLGADLSLKVVKDQKQPVAITINQGTPQQQTRYYQKTLWDLKLLGDLKARVAVVYPFKYQRGTAKPNYKVQLAATITLMKKDLARDGALRRPRAVYPAVITKDKWASSAQAPKLEPYSSGNVAAPAVVTLFSSPESIKVKSDIQEEEDALCEDVLFDFPTINLSLATEMKESATITPNEKDVAVLRTVDEVDSSGTVIKQDSEPQKVNLGLSNAELSGALENIGQDEYAPYIQIWARIFDNNNKVVDLVPAYWKDDTKVSEQLEIGASEKLPLVRFVPESAGGAPGLAITRTAFEAVTEVIKPTFYPNVYFANDPRFNYAPEFLTAETGCTVDDELGKYWFEQVQNSKSRDGDIFMTTSDAGYMQSAYELAHILDLSAGGDYVMGVLDDGQGYNGNFRNAASGLSSDLAAKNAMWRSYTQYKLNGRENMISPLGIMNGTRGFRINPYTGDVNVMLAALANTPLDWWAASTNDLNDAWGSTKSKMLDSLKEANKYTFSKHSGAMVQFEHGKVQDTPKEGTLVALAKKMMSHFRHLDTDNGWEDAFDHEIDWKQEDLIDGVDFGVTLHSVDKKFLHGYWRECFANRQQLFLIFVRAEPMMLGGGGLGQTPPQLGARAVALVWRDPKSTGNDDQGVPKPHRTRLLFYRQFD